MIGRFQRVTTISILLLAAGWLWFFVARGQFGFAACGVFLIVFGYAVFLALEFGFLLALGQEKDQAAPKFVEVVRAWTGEVLRTPSVFCWRQPFREFSEPDFLEPRHHGQRGALLLHGFMCNRGFWNPWLRRFHCHGVPFIAISLEPAFGSIAALAPQIEAAVARLERVTGLRPVVVAHSMGGLAVRAWLATRPDSIDRVHRIVTIASPHRGTWLARFFHAPNGLEMRRGNAWLGSIATQESPEALKRFLCFYGPCDNIVFPVSTATLPGADNRRLEATAHVQMAFHPAVFDAVLEIVQPPKSASLRYP